MHKIHLLPDLLVNQIAAGEVIQRPSSVVKELIDNAIDASSTTITLVIKEAGKQLIQVIDDGIGMSTQDAQICFEKHTTSKISSLDDLCQIQTMGFRGEAMASIAAVAQVEMETRLHDASIGTYIAIEDAKVKKQSAIATAPGTKISVRNLFYNVPVRKNFLKSNVIEFKHIIEEVQRAALAKPDISFTLYHNDSEIYKLASTQLSHRIIHIFGDSYKKQLLPCKESTDILTITGYIGKPEQAKKTRGEQFLFVNNRFIKSPSLNHAIKSAYERCLPADSFPFYVINLTIDHRFIDVNVHPTKTAIKFQDEQTFYAMLQAVVKKSIASYPLGDALDFEQNINSALLPLTHPVELKINPTHRSKEHYYAQFKIDRTPSPPTSTHWKKLFPEHEHEVQTSSLSCALNAGTGQALQLYGSYIVTQIQSGVLLIDQQAAHERILYDKFLTSFQHKNGASQQLLIPEHLTVNPVDYAMLIENAAIMRDLGFIMEPFGTSTIVVYGVPVELGHHPPKPLLEALIEQYKWQQTKQIPSASERLISALAKKASIPHNTKMNAVEIDALLAQLFSTSNTIYTPDGRKICTVLAQDAFVNLLK